MGSVDVLQLAPFSLTHELKFNDKSVRNECERLQYFLIQDKLDIFPIKVRFSKDMIQL